MNLTNLSLSHKASSSTSRVVSALTSLDYANTGSSDINTLLNLDSSIDIYSDNPVAGLNSSSAANKYYEANAQIFVLAYAMQAFVNETNALSNDTKTFFESLYTSIQQNFDLGVTNLSEFIETTNFIDGYIDSVLSANNISLSSSASDDISGSVSSDLKSIVKSVIEKISVRNDSSATSAIINYATGTFLNDVIALANGTADADRIASYSSNLNSLIASDQNIDESSLDQALTLTDDSVSTDEDNSLEFSPLENDVIDAGSDYYGLSLSISSPSNGTASLDASNNITYSPNENFFGSDSLTYTVNVDGSSASANIDIDIISINDPPTFKDFVSTSSIDENTLNVLSVTVEDVEDDTIGYSLSGNDAEKLSISTSGAIAFKTNPDFENPTDTNSDNSYEITVEASDGTDSTSDDLVITILDVENEGNPIIEGLSSQSVNENESINISFTVTDPQNDTITYSLSGVDKDLFTLTFDGLNASLTSSSKDYEAPEDSDSNNVYLVSVNFSDELNTTSQEIEISVSNINDNNPIITSSDTFIVEENQTAVATLTASDEDNDNLTFSISGGDSSVLDITESGVLTFKEAPNFEAKNTYSITASVSDGTNSASQGLVINISNVNEAPVWNIPAISFEYQENTFNVESIDIPDDVSDEDGDSLTYSLTGEDASAFEISGNIVRFRGAPDYENPIDSDGDNVYVVNAVASDGSLETVSPEFTVIILNINDNNPVFVDLQESVEVTNGQVNVFDIVATDADGDDISLSVTGVDASAFIISDSDTLAFATAPDFANPSDQNGDNVYMIVLEATDGERITSSNQIEITVLEVNNPPVISDLLTSYTLDENIAEIATFTVTDPESNQLTIGVSGDDSAGFSVVSNLLFFEGGLNYESPLDSDADNVYTVTVFADDGFNRTTQDVQITVTDVPEAPEFVGLTSQVSIDENVRIVAALNVVDPEGGPVTFGINGGDDSALFRIFNIDSSNGNLAFNAFEGVDYETPEDANGDNVYEVQLIAAEDSAGGLETTFDLSISINDIKDTYTINGTLYSNRYTVVDGDVQNTLKYTVRDNNSLSNAQVLQNPTDVIGHIGDNTVDIVIVENGFCFDNDDDGACDTQTLENFDTEDWYKVTAAPNLTVTLQNEGLIYEDLPDNPGSFYCCEYDSMDLDLLLYNEDGSLANYSYTDSSTSTRKIIALPDSGTFYAVVKANSGHAKYVLTFGSNVEGASAAYFNPNDNFAKDRFISYIPFGPEFVSNGNETYPIDIYPDSDIATKFIQSDQDDRKGLRRFNLSVESEFKRLFGESHLDNIQDNPEQVEYLKHWKVLQHYKELHPRLNLELDLKAKLTNFTRDPRWNLQWNLQQIGLETALTAIGQGTKDVAVAVLDGGGPLADSTADSTSAFLPGGFDFVDFDNDPTDPQSSSGSHGTHVGSTIAALNDGNNINGFGIGVVSMRVMGTSGTGFTSDIIQGLLFAGGLPNSTGSVYQGTTPIKAMNLSLGSTGGGCSSSYQGVFNDLYDRNISVVSSSGNAAQEAPGAYGYPASCENVISVGATAATGLRAYYSTYNDAVDIAAPGGDVGADVNADGYSDGVLAFDSNEDLAFYQGTSMASPHVAGAIGILYALVPELLASQVDALIIDGHIVDDIGPEGKDDDYGYGLLNINKAVARIIDEEGLDFTYGSINPGTANLGLEFNSYDITVSKVGDGELSVASITNDLPSAVTISEIDVDESGFGTYRLTFDRSSLPDGLYRTNTRVTFSNENIQSSVATFQVGPERDRPYVEFISTYLYQVDEVGGTISLVFGNDGEMVDGEVAFTAENLPDGQYYFSYFSFIDNFIRDVGEFEARYPDAGSGLQYMNLAGSDLSTSVTLGVNKSVYGISKLNNKKKYRVYKINPPIKKDN